MSKRRPYYVWSQEAPEECETSKYDIELICVIDRQPRLEWSARLSEARVITFASPTPISVFGSGAFYDYALCSIHIPSSVEVIECDCFRGCSSLQNVYLSDQSKLRLIDKSAFRETSLRLLILPPSLERIGPKCFAGLNSAYFGLTLLNPTQISGLPQRMLSGSQITCVRIPASIEKLEKECFANCQNLTRVEIDDHCHLLEFGDSLFSNCSSLRSLTIPKSVTTLGSCCFLGCGNLTSISFPLGSQLRKIGVRCFEDTRFHSVMIPASVKEIGEAAFRCCIYPLTVIGEEDVFVPDRPLQLLRGLREIPRNVQECVRLLSTFC